MKTYLFLSIFFFGFYLSAQNELLCQGSYWTEAEAIKVMEKFKSQWKTQTDWEERASIIRQGILNGLQWDKMPEVSKPPKLILSPLEYRNGYAVQNVALESFPGFYVTGNLYTPLNLDPPYAAILSTHGHFGGGRFTENEQKRNGALAQMGAVVFAYDMVGYGESNQVDHKMPIALLLQTWNSKRVLDYLVSREDIDTDRIGISGASGGGTQTFILSAIDSRIDVSIPVVQVSAHFFGGCVCESGMPIHKSNKHQTNNVEIAALMAPKPQLIISDGADWTKNTPAVEFPYLKKVYQTFGADSNIRNAHFENEQHDYGPSKRDAAYRFFSTTLKLPRGLKAHQEKYDESSIEVVDENNLKLFSYQQRPKNELKGNDAVIAYLQLELQ
jgi:dienelactone hydrolase